MTTCRSLLGPLVAFALLMGCSAPAKPPFVAPGDRPQSASEMPWPEGGVMGLAYHDVQDQNPDNTFMTVRTANLIDQLALLRENGYQPVSVDQILAARNGGPALPDKAVLLSFDDGFSSFHTRVLPILRAYQWPAVLAPVGSWLDTPADQPVDFGGLAVNRLHFADEAQLREIAESGLVELGAHTYNLHFGALANPQGNLQPAASSRLFSDEQGYESEEEYRARLTQDIVGITDRLTRITGQAPRVWVWPYGSASGTALELVGQHGYELALTLESGLSTMTDLSTGARILLDADPELPGFASQINQVQSTPTHRVIHVDLDYVYDPDPIAQQANLDLLVQRIADMRTSTVFLQAYADPSGDGTVRELYFPNRHLPVRADLFNRVAWQLKTRANINHLYAWMPVLSYELSPDRPRVRRISPHTGDIETDPDQYQRLSPFDPENRRIIGEIYEDLAASSHFTGLLFHDDALLSDYEDASPLALEAYRNAGFGNDILAIRENEDQFWDWSRFKSRYLIDFTQELAGRVRAIRGPQIKTARNLFAEPILNPYSETWFAQNLDDFLETYDWTAPMAMPLMESVPDTKARAWLTQLVQEVRKRPDGLNRTIFELQAMDWRSLPARPVSDHVLLEWIETLQWQGVRHFGYYPDDFHNDQPALSVIRPSLSNAWEPKP
ncbi:poly-beta-1,6-N-acetyl-D-glucosamine N-deacetylase PgaB [Marinobacter daepoensis]|uniref:Poly-beta-1,6-N-acetyl-D-glucosamine N-deacetylase PgaB n=1 Tax=Marinobacter daepoensis TaxID=262077 RepID=A0ABS3BD57_9GAMM|nr:poly-beta-1,6-N-acetyl-D-glucosamine N-deacetylase PgaB [Marinobacter daepoensis]MBY6078438.1 poly-beta-1,6-N-acetyl-D-glucosamine N-deacetylase PgaB [Marinobacter daepoensis]